MEDLAVADTGTTGHYLTLNSPCSNKRKAIHPLPIQMLNGEIIESTHTALLNHQDLPLHARQAHIFPGLKKALLFIGTFCEHGCEANFNNKSVHIKDKQSGSTIMRGTRYARTNLYMLSLTHQNNVMTDPKTPDEYFAGSAYECKSENTLVDYHHASCWIPAHSGRRKAITKTSSSIGQAYQWTWFTNTSRRNNPPYLGISSNRGRASYPHKKISCTQTQIQSMTSSFNPHSQKTPILSFSRQMICPGKFTQIKQEGSQSPQVRVISISSSLNTLTQTPSTLNLSRQDQDWTSQQSTRNSTAC